MSDTRTALLEARAGGAPVVVQPGQLVDYLSGRAIRTGSVRPQGNTVIRMMIARYRLEPTVMMARAIAAEGASHPDPSVRAICAAIGAAS